MNLFSFNKTSYEVHISEEVLLLSPFKAVYNKDKSKDKDLALKEFAVIWLYSDITSPYQSILINEDRLQEIKKDIDLPAKWKMDKIVEDAIAFYISKSTTPVHNMYYAAMSAASAVNEILMDSKALIDASEDKLAASTKVITALEKVPKVMAALREVEKELVRQIEDKEGKKIGSKTFSMYEDGLTID